MHAAVSMESNIKMKSKTLKLKYLNWNSENGTNGDYSEPHALGKTY